VSRVKLRDSKLAVARPSWEEAARKCGVPVADLKLWMIEHTKVGSTRWSNWNSGREPVPEKHLIAFLRSVIDDLRGQLERTTARARAATSGPEKALPRDPVSEITFPAEVAEDAHQPPASAADARYFVEPLIVAAASHMPEAARPRFQFRAAHIHPSTVVKNFVALVEREPLPSDVEPAAGTTALRSSIVELIADAESTRRNRDEQRRDGGEATTPQPRGISGYRLLRRRPRNP
jgi:hypothetical protein